MRCRSPPNAQLDALVLVALAQHPVRDAAVHQQPDAVALEDARPLCLLDLVAAADVDRDRARCPRGRAGARASARPGRRRRWRPRWWSASRPDPVDQGDVQHPRELVVRRAEEVAHDDAVGGDRPGSPGRCRPGSRSRRRSADSAAWAPAWGCRRGPAASSSPVCRAPLARSMAPPTAGIASGAPVCQLARSPVAETWNAPEHAEVEVAAAHHGERVGVVEVRRARQLGDGDLAGVDQVGIHRVAVRLRSHAEHAVLGVQHDAGGRVEVVGHLGRLADAEVDERPGGMSRATTAASSSGPRGASVVDGTHTTRST